MSFNIDVTSPLSNCAFPSTCKSRICHPPHVSNLVLLLNKYSAEETHICGDEGLSQKGVHLRDLFVPIKQEAQAFVSASFCCKQLRKSINVDQSSDGVGFDWGGQRLQEISFRLLEFLADLFLVPSLDIMTSPAFRPLRPL